MKAGDGLGIKRSRDCIMSVKGLLWVRLKLGAGVVWIRITAHIVRWITYGKYY